MILSPRVVLKYGFIKNLSERDATNPEGAGLDVRIGEAFRIVGEGFLGKETRKTPDIEEIRDEEIVLRPGDYILVRTMEEVELPGEPVYIEELGDHYCVMADVRTRSTLFRSGVLLLATKVDPGYYGRLVFGMKNLGDTVLRIERGARIANVIFLAVAGDCNTYRGQWKGGRVAVPEGEKQV